MYTKKRPNSDLRVVASVTDMARQTLEAARAPGAKEGLEPTAPKR